MTKEVGTQLAHQWITSMQKSTKDYHHHVQCRIYITSNVNSLKIWVEDSNIEPPPHNSYPYHVASNLSSCAFRSVARNSKERGVWLSTLKKVPPTRLIMDGLLCHTTLPNTSLTSGYFHYWSNRVCFCLSTSNKGVIWVLKSSAERNGYVYSIC